MLSWVDRIGSPGAFERGSPVGYETRDERNQNMKRLILCLWLVSLFLIAAPARETAARDTSSAPVKVLIIDGQNNHNWRATTPVLKAILEDAGIFKVDVATTPKNMSDFKPDFSKYDVILLNYNGADWPESVRRDFVSFVRSGGGVVVVHAADNSFPGWKEYNEMIGLGGWGGRNEKWGPYLYSTDGKIVRDFTPGRAGSHGPQHAFQVVIRDKTHPITAGLPEKWLHVADELYSQLRGPAKNLTLLATAYADPKKGGTGRDEPILFTIRYGKGRIFHTVLGHDVPQMKCMGFVFTLQRGTEWAARGKVTLTKVPEDFPTAHKTRIWLPNAAFESVKTYDFGKSRADLAAMAPGVSGALLTTVAGLLVAIPSMFGYNWLVHHLRVHTVELDNFAQELVSEMETEYLGESEEL